MPYIVKPRRTRRIALASFAATLAIGALPAVANAEFGQSVASEECPSLPTSLRFQSSGDNAEYSAVPGGTFEGGSATGWSLNDATLSTENEGPEGGSGSVVIQPGGSVVSPPFCVSNAYPTFRFFARKISGEGSLNVRLRRTNGHSFFIPNETSAGSLNGASR